MSVIFQGKKLCGNAYCWQVVTDYTNVAENSSVCVYVRARPPDPSWTLQDDDASVEDKFQNPLQATLAGTSCGKIVG